MAQELPEYDLYRLIDQMLEDRAPSDVTPRSGQFVIEPVQACEIISRAPVLSRFMHLATPKIMSALAIALFLAYFAIATLTLKYGLGKNLHSWSGMMNGVLLVFCFVVYIIVLVLGLHKVSSQLFWSFAFSFDFAMVAASSFRCVGALYGKSWELFLLKGWS